MLIAGEASGDLLAAELVSALRDPLPDARFLGAGGPKMAAAGVELAFDLTQHSVVGDFGEQHRVIQRVTLRGDIPA